MKNLLAAPQFRRSAHVRARTGMMAQADTQLATIRRTIAEIRLVQAETAELQAETAQTLKAIRSSNVAKTS